MPVSFLTEDQRNNYGRYIGAPTDKELACFFHMSDDDQILLMRRRGNHNKLGFALQLGTVRFLGKFLEDPMDIPDLVIQAMAAKLNINEFENIHEYRTGEQRWDHANEICEYYGYRDITDPIIGFRLSRWLCELCWTGTERPGVLFDRAKNWLLVNKILLPGISTLERLIARVRSRMEHRLWNTLVKGLTVEQKTRLNELLVVEKNSGMSFLERLRTGPVRVSGNSLHRAISRSQEIRNMDINLPDKARIPPSRLTTLARFAATARVTAISRLKSPRKLATLVAFMHGLEAAAQDDVLDVLGMLLRQLFNRAKKEEKKTRQRSLKDLDQSAAKLADACLFVLDVELPDNKIRGKIFEQTSREILELALNKVIELVRPENDVYFRELKKNYRGVRRFLPALLKHVEFQSNPAGKPVVDAFEWLKAKEIGVKPLPPAPRAVIRKAWEADVINKDDSIDHCAYIFCMLDELQLALNRRDAFVNSSWHYRDPRAGLLDGHEWETTRPIICRTLGLSVDPEPTLTGYVQELDQTYRAVAARLSDNPSVRFEEVDNKSSLILTPLDKLDEPETLIALRNEIDKRLPQVDLPDILLEMVARTKLTDEFTHISETKTRIDDFDVSLCAVLLAGACNTGIEPMVNEAVPALKLDRLLWVDQNYIRNESISSANAVLVSVQSKIPFALQLGGGEVASADGMRFVVPVQSVHAGFNPKYYGREKGVTWYNMISNQFSGLNAVCVPGTLRDSLILLAVVLEQQTELQPTQIMTDTGAYSDVVFGLFLLLGYRFSPRIADTGSTRFWRVDAEADYGLLNDISASQLKPMLITQNWDDMLRFAGSLKLGKVSATGIMRTLQVGERPTPLAKAIAELGRIAKTIHVLNYIDDESKRRVILTQLNRGEGRHSLARKVFHGERGELRQKYREGQEDQLGTLGLVLNIIILWNTIYIDAILDELRQEGFCVLDEDVARLSPLVYKHINMLGRYFFIISEAISKGELRPLRNISK